VLGSNLESSVSRCISGILDAYKSLRDTRPGKMTSVVPWVFGASIAVCIGMCDGMLDTRGMAVWWVVDAIFVWLSIVDVAQDVGHAAVWYLGGWKDAVRDEAAKGEKLGAVVSVRVQDHILQMKEEMNDVEVATDTKPSGEVKLQSWFQNVKKNQVAEGVSMG
jgi:hypothetical protein